MTITAPNRLNADAPVARNHQPRRARRAMLRRPVRIWEHGPHLRLFPGAPWRTFAPAMILVTDADPGAEQVFVASEVNGLHTLRQLVWDSIRVRRGFSALSPVAYIVTVLWLGRRREGARIWDARAALGKVRRVCSGRARGQSKRTVIYLLL